LEEVEGGHVLACARLEVMRWQCRFMQATSTLTDFNQRQGSTSLLRASIAAPSGMTPWPVEQAAERAGSRL
jgi:hypothetical protein